MSRVFSQVAALSLVFFASHAGAEENAHVTRALGAVHTQYSTTLGPIALEVPKGYVGLSQVDSAYFDMIVAPFRKGLQTLEVFITAEDWHETRKQRVLIRGQMFLLQLPAPNTPPMEDATWKSVRSEMISSVAGNDAEEWINRAEGPAAKRFNEVHNQNFISNIDVGKAVIYHAGTNDIRWMTKSNVAYQTDKGPATYSALIASAFVRKGRQIIILQSMARGSTANELDEVMAKLDTWVSAIR